MVTALDKDGVSLIDHIIPISELQSQAKKIVERVKNTRDSVLIYTARETGGFASEL